MISLRNPQGGINNSKMMHHACNIHEYGLLYLHTKVNPHSIRFCLSEAEWGSLQSCHARVKRRERWRPIANLVHFSQITVPHNKVNGIELSWGCLCTCMFCAEWAFLETNACDRRNERLDEWGRRERKRCVKETHCFQNRSLAKMFLSQEIKAVKAGEQSKFHFLLSLC